MVCPLPDTEGKRLPQTVLAFFLDSAFFLTAAFLVGRLLVTFFLLAVFLTTAFEDISFVIFAVNSSESTTSRRSWAIFGRRRGATGQLELRRLHQAKRGDHERTEGWQR